MERAGVVDGRVRAWPYRVTASRLLAYALPAVASAIALFHPVLTGKAIGGHVMFQPPFASISVPHAGAFMDVEAVILPFLCHGKRELSRGRIPLWNPYAGLGAPFLANQQSAVLHPATLLAWLLPWRHTLTALAVFRFLLAYAGMLWLSRDMGLSPLHASGAACAYSFSGSIVAFLCYPLGSVYAHLPLAIVLGRRAGRERRVADSLALAAAIGSLLLAGHLEYVAVIVATAVVSYAWTASPSLASVTRLFLILGIGFSLGAPLVLPAAEYLALSTWMQHRVRRQTIPLDDVRYLPSIVDASMLHGPPADDLAAHGSNALLGALGYVGSAGLVLALVGSGSRRGAAVLLCSLAAMAIIWSNPLSRQLWRAAPVAVHADRMLFLWAFGASILVGLGLQGLTGRRAPLLATTGLAIAVLLVLCERRVYVGLRMVPTPAAWMALVPGAVVLLLVWLGTMKMKTSRWPALLTVAVLVGERGMALPKLNPWQRPCDIFPGVPILERIRDVVGKGRIAALDGLLHPDTATAYELRDVRLYDAIGIRSRDEALEPSGQARFFGLLRSLPTAVTRESAVGVLLMGAKDGERVVEQGGVDARVVLAPGETLVQQFPALDGEIGRLALYFARRLRAGTGALLELRRDRRAGPVWQAYVPAPSMPWGGWASWRVDPPVATRAGDTLFVSVRCVSERQGGSFELAAAPRKRGPRLIVDGRIVDKALAFKVGFRSAAVVLAEAQGLSAVEDAQALPRARLAISHRDASIVRDEATWVSIDTRSEGPDRLLLADQYYPGWMAAVDGHPAPIEAEGPFRAVGIPAGHHRVDFLYRPMSFQVGLFLGLLATLSTGAAVTMGPCDAPCSWQRSR